MEGESIRIQVEGMTCGHCEASVRAALERLEGVSVDAVDRSSDAATFRAPAGFDPELAVEAIRAIGFDASV